MISDSEFRRRVMSCWLGKSVGGTLGMPYEGVRHTLDLTYYDPVPTEMLPNDDLDAQVVYAYLLDRMAEPRVDRHVLTEAWQHIGMSPDEYGICKRNLKLGLVPPATGSYDNPFTRGMGAAIRTELWACLAPDDPELAAAYAYEDACMDHADEGIAAATFLAAWESLAFVERDRERLLDRAIAFLPDDTELYQAVADTRQWWAESGDWQAVQRRLAERYLNDNFTDVVINVAYIVLGWVAGDGAFGKSICIAVNCGQDTDCTGATLGALLGICDPESIEEQWLTPIGQELVLSESVRGVTHPKTLDGFTDQVLDLRNRLKGRRPAVDDAPQATDHLAVRVDMGFVDGAALPTLEAGPCMPANAEVVYLPGQYVQWPSAECKGEQVWLRYCVTLEQARKVHVLFNTPEPMRVWLDGKGLLAGEGGAFVPAMHRAPKGQIATVELAEGEHEIVAVMRRPGEGKPLTWCVGLADTDAAPVERDWLVGVFERQGAIESGGQDHSMRAISSAGSFASISATDRVDR
ncbi:ADP-ribosylglycohydrolase family protein [Phycisphaerales bacterium AB-hyl4]|uniref:ADP-ribosylglycohydrolase family protein n=1 Tax=Natronomicrosphaera hydrolytica TaxID=3242702 RepID=A0ABV4TZC2_9BACT